MQVSNSFVKVINPYKALVPILLIVGIAIIGCSTEKDAWLNRTYHNTTAKYNGYFNAGEIIKEAMTNYSETRTENYNVIIPIYEYADEIRFFTLSYKLHTYTVYITLYILWEQASSI